MVNSGKHSIDSPEKKVWKIPIRFGKAECCKQKEACVYLDGIVNGK